MCGDFNGWQHDAGSRLTPIGGGHWAGFVAGLGDGDAYLFYVDGPGGSGYKRDPRARLLTFAPAFPSANGLLRDPSRFPWHEVGFRPPAWNDTRDGASAVATGRSRNVVSLKFVQLANAAIWLSVSVSAPTTTASALPDNGCDVNTST